MADNIVVGFQFNDEASSKKALQELNAILKIKEKKSSLSADKKLALFNQLIDENYFSTPVGFEFLRESQKELFEDKTIDSNKIKAIPVLIKETHKEENVVHKQVNTDISKQDSNINSRHNSKNSKYKERFVKSMIINIVFALVILIMFVITQHAKKYDLNYYRESVENEYINWENDLKERESIINEKENPS